MQKITELKASLDIDKESDVSITTEQKKAINAQILSLEENLNTLIDNYNIEKAEDSSSN